jgi:hypothetical protein
VLAQLPLDEAAPGAVGHPDLLDGVVSAARIVLQYDRAIEEDVRCRQLRAYASRDRELSRTLLSANCVECHADDDEQ